MAVVSVERTFTGRGGSQNLMRRRTYRDTFEVIVNSTGDDEQVVANAIGIPRLGGSHHRDILAIVVDVAPEQSEETPYIWHVHVTYDSQPDFPNAVGPDGELAPGEIPSNPLLMPATWRFTFTKTTEPATKWYAIDKDGVLSNKLTAILNSSGLPFDPPLNIEKARPVIRVTKNVPFVTADMLMQFEDAINDRQWGRVPKWCAKIDGVESGNKRENGVAFVELTLDIALKRDTWMPKILDAGFYEKTQRTEDGTPPKQVIKHTKIRDPFGHEATEPQPLDGNGKKLKFGEDPVFLRGMPDGYHLEDFRAMLGI